MSKSDRSRFKTIFVCQQCGKESLRWLGRCPNCQEWNSFAETKISVATSSKLSVPESSPLELSRVTLESADRFPLLLGEFDRVLGGGVVSGSLVLIAGAPGIGKSTLLLQASASVAEKKGNIEHNDYT